MCLATIYISSTSYLQLFTYHLHRPVSNVIYRCLKYTGERAQLIWKYYAIDITDLNTHGFWYLWGCPGTSLPGRMIYTFSGVLFSLKKEGNSGTS